MRIYLLFSIKERVRKLFSLEIGAGKFTLKKKAAPIIHGSLLRCQWEAGECVEGDDVADKIASEIYITVRDRFIARLEHCGYVYRQTSTQPVAQTSLSI